MMIRLALSSLVSASLLVQHAPAVHASTSNSSTPSLRTPLAPTLAAPRPRPPPAPETVENWRRSRLIIYTWLGISLILMVYVLGMRFNRYIRNLICLNKESLRCYNEPSPTWDAMRKHLFDAPLFRKRHHRQFQITKKIDAGTLPSRLQTVLLAWYIGVMTYLTVIDIDVNMPRNRIYGSILKRTGHMALINMIPLLVMAARNNPLIQLTGVTFDTYNFFHRWIGRVVVIEIFVHAVVYVMRRYETGGWAFVQKAIHMGFIQAGTVAAIAFFLIFCTAYASFRHRFYETFLHLHIALAGISIAGIYIHMKGYVGHTNTILGVLSIWIIERSWRLLTIVYRNIGNGGGQAEVKLLPGNAARICVKMARPWSFRPGQHAYIYLPTIGLWTSHPFSVAWSDVNDEDLDRVSSLSANKRESLEEKSSYVYFVVRRQAGFTNKLWQKAASSPDGIWRTQAIVEGPYGEQCLRSFGTVLLFAAGVGITHQLPHVWSLIQGYSNGQIATRRLVLIWIIQVSEHLEWIQEWMARIFSQPRRREILKVLLFVTRPTNSSEITSSSSSVKMFPGKPNIQAIVDCEVAQSIGAIGVSVCGIGAVADEVRHACRSWMGKVNIEFEEESFSW